MKTQSKQMKTLLLFAITITSTTPVLSQSVNSPLYMGKASTGEEVWFYGGRAQCGDLPRAHECWWRNPMIMYTLDKEEFNTILDCKKGIFKEVHSVTNNKQYYNINPTSAATEKMVEMTCSQR